VTGTRQKKPVKDPSSESGGKAGDVEFNGVRKLLDVASKQKENIAVEQHDFRILQNSSKAHLKKKTNIPGGSLARGKLLRVEPYCHGIRLKGHTLGLDASHWVLNGNGKSLWNLLLGRMWCDLVGSVVDYLCQRLQ
jgi:hypothetical protein